MTWATAVNTGSGLAWLNHRRSLPCMRVVAGDLRGRRIESPSGDATRPTTDKVREAVFNALGSLDVVDGANVVDAFAGTGAMGIEALSRGAAHCTFIEKDRDALQVLKRNIATLGLADRSSVVSVDVIVALAQHGDCDLFIADPPYGFSDWSSVLRHVTASVVVLESDRDIAEVDGWETVRAKKYGRTHVAFLQPAGEQSDTVEGT
jgi:16S rRNA (guanine966-N2)-methyltransferase